MHFLALDSVGYLYILSYLFASILMIILSDSSSSYPYDRVQSSCFNFQGRIGLPVRTMGSSWSHIDSHMFSTKAG